MSAVTVTRETPQAAARRLAAGAIRDGYQPDALHVYRDADGRPVYWRIRCRRADGSKWIRPMHWTGAEYAIGEPPAPPAGKPLYRLPEVLAADPAAPVYVAEGETCADALARLGIVATTSGGATSADGADWTPLRGRCVVIWPDHDGPGLRYADAVAGILRELGCTVEVIDAAALGVPEHGDCVDWLAAHPDATAADVDALPRVASTCVQASESAGGDVDAARSPQPLPAELPEVPAFPLDALPDSLRPWIADVSDRMQCPPDFVAVPMLVAAASLVARHVAIRPQARTDWMERPNLWAMIVGRPGAMKSPALAQALAPIERLERAARAEHAERMQAFESDALAAKLRKEAAEGAAKRRLKGDAGADVTDLLRGAQEPEPPPRVRYIVHDVTYEALGIVLSENAGGVLSVRDEMKSLLADLSKEEKAAQRGFFVQAWSGGSYTFDRIIRGHIHIEDARLSMLGGIQPGPLSELVRAARSVTSAADGLLERFLFAWPDDPREWREVDRWPDSAARSMAHDAFDDLDRLTPEAIGAEQDKTKQGEAYGPHYLRFDGAALELFAEWRCDLERKLRDPDEGMESALSKFRHHVPALALTLHLLDGNQGSVCEIATLRALALAEYFEAHARRCYASSRRAAVKAANAILRKLEIGALPEPFSARDVHRKCWTGLCDVRTVADALDMLAAHGWLIEDAIDTGGRPKTIYWRPAGGAA